MNVSIASVNTGSFDFMAIGNTPEEARQALMEGWARHCEAFDADPDYLIPEEINIITGNLGDAFRNGSLIK